MEVVAGDGDGQRSKMLGKWRLTEAEQLGRTYLGIIQSAYIGFDQNGLGELNRAGIVGG